MIEQKRKMAQSKQGSETGSFIVSEVAPSIKNLKLQIKRDGPKLNIKSLKMPT